MSASNESINLLTQTYRDKALDTFIRGLNGDLPKLLGMREPSDLPQALHLCLKLENQTYRANYAQNTNFSGRRSNFQMQSPPLPPRNQTRFQQPHYNRNIQMTSRSQPMTFYPHLAHVPRTSQEQFRSSSHQDLGFGKAFGQQPQAPLRPPGAKPQARAEPMEIDETIRSRKVNYMNRPRPGYTIDRPPTSVNQPQRKIARNFHIDSEYSQYEANTGQERNQEEETFEDYLASTQEPTTLENEQLEFSDIHFLG